MKTRFRPTPSTTSTGAIVALVLATWSGVYCARGANPATPGAGDSVQAGIWGGDHIELTVRADGASVEFDCGTATVDGAVSLGKDSAFDVRGRYFQEGGGPTRRDEDVTPRPLRLTGTVKGRDMTLRAVLTDGNDVLGDFALTLGKTARLIKCR